MPERDIESLGVMGWGLEAARKFFRRHRHRPLAARALRPWAIRPRPFGSQAQWGPGPMGPGTQTS